MFSPLKALSLALIIAVTMPTLSSAAESVKSVGSSGKYFPTEVEACEAATVDARTNVLDVCDGTPGPEGPVVDPCDCERGGFEGEEFLCSAAVTLSCIPEEVVASVAASGEGTELRLKIPESTTPIQLASLVFERRGESIPPEIASKRLAGACSDGFSAACGANSWRRGSRYDLRRAGPFVQQACKEGDDNACIVSGWALEAEAIESDDASKYVEAARIYKNLCDRRENARACYEYGTILFNSLGVRSIPRHGTKRWTDACKAGEAAACTVLAKIYRQGLNVEQDEAVALDFAVAGCEAGDAAGCLEKVRIQGDADEILEMRVQHCTQGSASECRTLAAEFLSGNAVEPRPGLTRGLLGVGCELSDGMACKNAADLALKDADDTLALQQYRRGCELGVIDSCASLAEMVMADRGGSSVNDEQYAFEAACSKSHVSNACNALALTLLEGDRPSDRARVRALLRQSCVDETSPAQSCFVLGDLYESGAGGEKDRTAAALYYKWSCAQGWGEACERRGDLLHIGVGVRQDDAEALAMYQFACDRALSDACYEAGVIADEGTHIPRDPVRALGLFTKACDQKVGAACTRLGRLQLEGAANGRNEEGARESFETAVKLEHVPSYRKLSWVLWNGVGGKKDKKRAKELAAAGCQADDPVACRGPAFQTETN